MLKPAHKFAVCDVCLVAADPRVRQTQPPFNPSRPPLPQKHQPPPRQLQANELPEPLFECMRIGILTKLLCRPIPAFPKGAIAPWGGVRCPRLSRICPTIRCFLQEGTP